MKRSPVVDTDNFSQSISISISHCDSPPVAATPTVSAFDLVLMDSRLASFFTLFLAHKVSCLNICLCRHYSCIFLRLYCCYITVSTIRGLLLYIFLLLKICLYCNILNASIPLPLLFKSKHACDVLQHTQCLHPSTLNVQI